MNAETINIIFQSITLLAVFAAVWQLFLRSKKMHRDTEMIFVQRYWLIMDRKSPQFVIKGKPTASDELNMLQYLRLCEDEVDHRRLGKIPRDTWMPWQEAMREQPAEPHYANVLEKTYPQFPGVRTVLASSADYDPHPQNRFIQFLRGH
jgi:hypothetical protein